MNMMRVWPLFCQFGIGALLCAVGIWCGLRGGYLDLKLPEDRRLLIVLIAGFMLMLLIACVFTFLSPSWAGGESA
jgi:hypothetical protein